ncbi:MAG TPA: AbrB/MazE/SpoVT family DNA-binding domain-containing protein [Nanoarchaeota archaeon]|nr:AbrB/MazE/SpoVT family DNA-binding domain-containing protein [Nanoarchaeota archaeon]
MERSLVKHGESTLMVSVPAAWAKRHHLEKGDAVDMLDEGECLVILRKGKKKAQLKLEIFFEKPDYDEIRAMLCKAYREGADEITVKYDDEEVFPAVHKVVASIFGYEITESKKGMCVIKNLIKEFDFDRDTVFKKIIQITDTMFNLTKEVLEGHTGHTLEKVHLLRDEGWKFRDASYAMLKKETIEKAFSDTYILHIYEQNSTYLNWLIERYMENRMKPVSANFLKMYDKVYAYFRNALAMMKKKDREYLLFIMENRRKLLEDCEAISAKGGQEAKLVPYLAMLIQNIHNPKSVLIA